MNKAEPLTESANKVGSKKRKSSHLGSILSDFSDNDFYEDKDNDNPGTKKIQQIVTTRDINRYDFGPDCNCKSDLLCTKVVSKAQRRYINDCFWLLEDDSQRYNFVLHHMEGNKIKKKTGTVCCREFNYSYYLPLSEDIFDTKKHIQVCQTMFTNTLGINKSLLRRVWFMHLGRKIRDYRHNIRPKCRKHPSNFRNMEPLPRNKYGKPCNCKKLLCHNKVSEEQRQIIYDHFWGLKYNKQRFNYAFKLIERASGSRPREGPTVFYLQYYLPVGDVNGEERVRVCKAMFQSTFCYAIDIPVNRLKSIKASGVIKTMKKKTRPTNKEIKKRNMKKSKATKKTDKGKTKTSSKVTKKTENGKTKTSSKATKKTETKNSSKIVKKTESRRKKKRSTVVLRKLAATRRGTVTQDQFDQIPRTNGYEVYPNEEYLDIPLKEEPLSEDEAMPLDCLLCTKTFRSLSGLKAHVIAQHSYKSVKRKSENSISPAKKRIAFSEDERPDDQHTDKHVCPTCRRSFSTSTDLKVHETCHDKFCCFACNAKFDSFREVSRHRRSCTATTQPVKPKTLDDAIRERAQAVPEAEEDIKEVLQCLKCKVSFKDKFYLRLHNAIQHRDKEAEKSKDKTQNEIDKENLEIANEKIKQDKRKYDKIEVELESIFDCAEEKEPLDNKEEDGKDKEEDGKDIEDSGDKTIENAQDVQETMDKTEGETESAVEEDKKEETDNVDQNVNENVEAVSSEVISTEVNETKTETESITNNLDAIDDDTKNSEQMETSTELEEVTLSKEHITSAALIECLENS